MSEQKIVGPEDAKIIVQFPCEKEAWVAIDGFDPETFRDCQALQVDVPVPNYVINHLAGAIDTHHLWSSLDNMIREVVRESRKVGSHKVVKDLFNPVGRYRYVRVLLPIPNSLWNNPEYDIASEIISEVHEALVIAIRDYQVNKRGRGPRG